MEEREQIQKFEEREQNLELNGRKFWSFHEPPFIF